MMIKRARFDFYSISLAMLLVFSFVWSVSPVRAATITVNSGCTLAQAIESANRDTAVGGCVAGSGADTINIPAGISNFIVVDNADNALPIITTDIIFQGVSPSTTVIRRIVSSPDFRLFNVTGGSVTFRDMTIEGGRADTGSGVRISGGNVTFENVTFKSNRSTSSGGALWIQGATVNAINSRFENNQASVTGGAITLVNGTLSLSNNVLTGNVASGFSGGGGAIFVSDATATLISGGNNVFQSNSTAGRGAGIRNNAGQITINNDRFLSNIATNQGGGIYAQGGQQTITNTTFTTNLASDGGGLFFTGLATPPTITTTTVDSNGATSGAGGMTMIGGSITVQRSTFSRNQSTNGTGGILFDGAAATLTNSTLSGNDGLSGAIRAINSATVNLRFTTIYSNIRRGAVGTHAGGLNVLGSAVTLNNSLIGDNSGTDCLILTGASISGANNLIQSACDTVGTGGTPTGVLALANNGGTTRTHALLPTSNALHQADAAACASQTGNVDQRGETRPSGTGCDIGAFELQGTTPTLTIDTSNIITAQVGIAYNRSLQVTGGTAPYTWSATTATINGLTLGSNGAITGTPTAAGTISFNVTVTDNASPSNTATATVNVPVETVNLNLSPVLLPNARQGVLYSTTVVASGGTGSYNYALNTLPAPLTGILVINPTTGVMGGTITTAGTYTFPVTVTDTGLSISQDIDVTLTVLAPPVFSVATDNGVCTAGTGCDLPPLPASIPVNQPYSATVYIKGGTPPYIFDVTQIPTGLSLVPDGNNGRVTGTPLEGGTAAQVEFTFRDANGFNSGVIPYSLVVDINDKASITPTTLPAAAHNVAYDYRLQAQGGFSPYTYRLATGSNLPAGLSLASDGRITGTLNPSAGVSAGYTFNVVVRDSAPGGNIETTITLTMPLSSTPVIYLRPDTPLNGVNVTLPDGSQTVAYTQVITASGGTTPAYTYTLSAGALPPGFTLAPGTGQISGTMPAGTIVADTVYTFTVQAEDGNGNTGSRAYELEIKATPQITLAPDNLPQAYTNVPYTTTLSASGGTAPYTFSVTGLPAGLTLSGATISGTPTGSGTVDITVTATDANTQTGSKTYQLQIGTTPPLTITPDTLPAGMVGNLYNQRLTAANGDGNYTFSTVPVSPSPLPPGLTLASNGNITGTPTSEVTTTFTVLVQDGSGQSATKDYTIVISRRLEIVYISSPTPSSVLDMGVALVGNSSSTSLIISEGGMDPLTVSSSGGTLIVNDDAGAFALGGDVPPFTIENGGASRTLTITCTPPDLGIFQATLVMNTNDPALPSVSYTLSCSGAVTLGEGESQYALPPVPPTIGRVFFVRGLAHRTGPYLGATMLGIVRPDVDYPVYGMSNDEGGDYTWYLIEANDTLGWASGRYLEIIGEGNIPMLPTDFDFIDDARDFGVGGTTYTNLNIRRRPSPRSPILATTEWGAQFALLGRTRQAGIDQWYHVRYVTPDNRTIVGWVDAQWIQLTGFIDVDVLPIR